MKLWWRASIRISIALMEKCVSKFSSYKGIMITGKSANLSVYCFYNYLCSCVLTVVLRIPHGHQWLMACFSVLIVQLFIAHSGYTSALWGSCSLPSSSSSSSLSLSLSLCVSFPPIWTQIPYMYVQYISTFQIQEYLLLHIPNTVFLTLCTLCTCVHNFKGIHLCAKHT